jgi:hypothetical protein
MELTPTSRPMRARRRATNQITGRQSGPPAKGGQGGADCRPSRARLSWSGDPRVTMAFPTALRALGHRDFRRFWLGQVVSLMGRWMQSVAQSWLVLELTGSPLKLAIVNSLQFAPLLFLAFPAGVVADRFPKQRLLVLSQLGLTVPALALAALCWTGQVQYWHVAVLATVMGIANALEMPTRQSMMVELVGRSAPPGGPRTPLPRSPGGIIASCSPRGAGSHTAKWSAP